MASASPKPDRFRQLGQLWLLVAAARLVAAFVMGRAEGPMAPDQLTASTILLVAHGIVYHVGARMRASRGAIGYFGVQITLVGSIALFSQSLWFSIVLFAALGAQAVTLVRSRFSAAKSRSARR